MSFLSGIGGAIGSFVGGPIGGLIGGGLGSAGDYFLGEYSTRKQNSSSAKMAREQMEFQERMRNTSYQAAVKDMEAAGLNPMLAYSQGGAAVPAGSMAPVANVAQGGQSSARTGVENAATMQQMAQSVETVKQMAAQTEKIKSETLSNDLNTALAVQQKEMLYQQGNLAFQKQKTESYQAEVLAVMKKIRELDLRRDTSTFSADVAKRKAESSLSQLAIPAAKAEAEWMEGIGKANPYLRSLIMLLQGANSARSAIGR